MIQPVSSGVSLAEANLTTTRAAALVFKQRRVVQLAQPLQPEAITGPIGCESAGKPGCPTKIGQPHTPGCVGGEPGGGDHPLRQGPSPSWWRGDQPGMGGWVWRLMLHNDTWVLMAVFMPEMRSASAEGLSG